MGCFCGIVFLVGYGVGEGGFEVYIYLFKN